MYLIILFEVKYFSLPYFQLHPSQVLEKDDQQIPIKDNNCKVSDVRQQSNEESEADEDMVPVEIRPGHIRFQPRGKGF
jgi:coilin